MICMYCMIFGLILFISSLFLLAFNIQINILFISIMAYTGLLLFGFGGLFTTIYTVKNCIEENHKDHNSN